MCMHYFCIVSSPDRTLQRYPVDLVGQLIRVVTSLLGTTLFPLRLEQLPRTTGQPSGGSTGGQRANLLLYIFVCQLSENPRGEWHSETL